jgi:prophage DNA circulation protein
MSDSASGLGAWADALQPASWRGVPFAVRSSQVHWGRRVAVHEYPFKDDVWVEDLGKGTRVVNFNGFLIGDDVFDQRDEMLAAAETPGPGDLVHPSLGSLSCNLTAFSAGERWDLGRVVEIEFSFIESGQDQPLFPGTTVDTQDEVDQAAFEADSAIVSDYSDDVSAPIEAGPDVTTAAKGTVTDFSKQAVSKVNDGSSGVNACAGIGGVVGGDSYFGRYNATGLTASPTIQINQNQSMSGRTSDAINAMISQQVDASQNVLTAQQSAIQAAAGL